MQVSLSMTAVDWLQYFKVFGLGAAIQPGEERRCYSVNQRVTLVFRAVPTTPGLLKMHIVSFEEKYFIHLG